MSFGLSDDTIKAIQLSLSSISEIDGAILYGSRAIGSYSPGSDTDLAITGNTITIEHIILLRTRIEDLSLPYTFDICHVESLTNKSLIDHIERVGIPLYKRNT